MAYLLPPRELLPSRRSFLSRLPAADRSPEREPRLLPALLPFAAPVFSTRPGLPPARGTRYLRVLAGPAVGPPWRGRIRQFLP